MENTNTENTENQEDTQTNEVALQIDEYKLKQYMEKLRLDQNLPLGIGAGIIASFAGAIVWAAVTVATKYQIGYMSLAIGFMVGYAVKFAGKGIDQIFGIAGAVLALLGCMLGNLLSIVAFTANDEQVGYFEVLSWIDPASIPGILLETGSPMDLLFYGLAIYEGYRFSFRNITNEELQMNAGKTAAI